MTDIQLKFWAQNETQRHNYATEAQAASELNETRRHNIAGERETQRHNLRTELQTDSMLVENVRHNMATEHETTRHNEQMETIGFGNLNETRRHNMAGERETRRHNVISESNDRRRIAVAERANDISQQQADTARYNASTQSSRANAQNTKDYASASNIRSNTMKTDKEIDWMDTINRSTVNLNAAKTVNQYTGSIRNVTGAASDVARILK